MALVGTDNVPERSVSQKIVTMAFIPGEGTGYADLTYTISLNNEEYGVGFRKGSDLAVALNDYFKKSMEDGSMKKCAETYKVQAALIEK